jgi:3alpha(or 20beta)-hydroxysteroid dehydrogenase
MEDAGMADSRKRFEDTVTIVTGGTRGMGEAVVRGLVAEGGRVVFGGRDEARGSAIEGELEGAAKFVRHDVGDEESWKDVVRVALDITGRIDGLVNNAGLMGQNPVAETSIELLAKLVSTNQTAVLLGIKHVVGPMRAVGRGSIVNIGSVVVRRGMALVSAYSGAKAAVAGITRSVAMELASDRIRVNAIHPGFFATQMLTDSMGEEGMVIGAETTPLGRVATTDEMVGPVLFLLSDESSFVTGAELDVDGGLSL